MKSSFKELVPKLFSSNPDLRIGIVAFGDYCDMKSKSIFGSAYQVLDLTNDENKIIKFINEAQNTSGGDGDEFYELVIKKITIKEIAVGDVFSEESHYIVEEIGKDTIKFKHTESGKSVTLGYGYVQDLLNTSDQYDKEVKVTKEDKKDGTPGIRTIFEGIKSSEVFTVVFQKQDKAKTKKQYEAEREAQRQEAVALIDKAKKAKKSMATAYKEALEHIQNNPIKDFIEGEDRVLRGYKMQFVSRDGKYKCLDMDIERNSKEDGIRLVNINTIKALVFNGVKYVVE